MRWMLSCPNRQFVKGHEGAEAVVEVLKGLGFQFGERQVPGGILLYAIEPVWIELTTCEELAVLQEKIGEPLRVELGVLEIAG